jgi:CheY-like chemotaxis protein
VIATARDDEREIVRLLDAGADDYLVKPFSAAQASARIRAVLRRVAPASAADRRVVVGDLVIDPVARTVHVAGAETAMNRKEFDLLLALASRPGEVISKRQLLSEVWHLPWGGADRTVDVHLSWLRRKLGETAAAPRYLHSVRGVSSAHQRGERRVGCREAPARNRVVPAGVAAMSRATPSRIPSTPSCPTPTSTRTVTTTMPGTRSRSRDSFICVATSSPATAPSNARRHMGNRFDCSTAAATSTLARTTVVTRDMCPRMARRTCSRPDRRWVPIPTRSGASSQHLRPSGHGTTGVPGDRHHCSPVVASAVGVHVAIGGVRPRQLLLLAAAQAGAQSWRPHAMPTILLLGCAYGTLRAVDGGRPARVQPPGVPRGSVAEDRLLAEGDLRADPPCATSTGSTPAPTLVAEGDQRRRVDLSSSLTPSRPWQTGGARYSESASMTTTW